MPASTRMAFRENASISGESLDEECFKFVEADGSSFQEILDVLNGRLLGVIYRDFVDAKTCETIRHNFWKSPHRYVRGADAPAQYIGTYHYRKPLDLYARESRRYNAVLPGLFDGAPNVVDGFLDRLGGELRGTGRTLRPARCLGEDACRFVMRSWSGTRSFALEPHDDESQCRDPLQAGFEIQEAAGAHPIGAVNICLENGEGGLLRMWNLRPDAESKLRLGLEVTGSPYPPELLDGFASVDVPIRAGDLYVFDGRFVHAVTVLDGKEQGARATIAFLLAKLGDREAIAWT